MASSIKPAARYPGFGLPLWYFPEGQRTYRYEGSYPLGINQQNSGCDSGMIRVREVAMMSVMDRLTDKPDRSPSPIRLYRRISKPNSRRHLTAWKEIRQQIPTGVQAQTARRSTWFTSPCICSVYGRTRVLEEELAGWSRRCRASLGRQMPVSPSNMGFQEDGSLKFTSYMNNLHPTRYPEIYRVIETLATTALPLDKESPGIWSPENFREAMGDLVSMPVTRKESNKPYHRPAFDQDSEDIEENEGEENEQEEEDRLLDTWEAIRSPILPDPEFIAVD
ncbi:hypothetical protein ACKVV1_007094 [Pyricularia oryzae]